MFCYLTRTWRLFALCDFGGCRRWARTVYIVNKSAQNSAGAARIIHKLLKGVLFMASNRKKAAYDMAYKKANYKRVVIDCRPEALAVLDDLAARSGLCRSAAVLAAARYCLRALSPEELRALASEGAAGSSEGCRG